MRFLLAFLLTLSLNAQIRINCGGATVTDSTGVVWSADQFFVGGIASAGAAGIPEPFGSVRFNSTPFTYFIPAPPGQYTLNLIFREQWVTASGQRRFSVAVNAQPFLTNLDLFAVSGAAQRVETMKVISNGTVQIVFTTLLRSAIINAIELIPIPVAPPSVLSMVRETWTTGTLPASFSLTFDPDPTTLVDVFLGGILQTSVHMPPDYALLSTSPPTVAILGSSTAPQVLTIRYWTTLSPATEILH